MTNLLRDAGFGFRLLRKNLGFAAVAILAIALGIGANTAIFSVVYATLLAPLPFPHPNQLVVVWSKVKGHRNGSSTGTYLDWQRENSVFQGLGTYGGADFNLSTGERPEQISGSLLTVGLLDKVYGETPFLGRYFLPDEAVAGKDHVVILTNRLWRDHFGSDPHIIGREIHLNGEAYTVIGVRPPGMGDRTTDRLHAPLVFKPEQINHDFHWLIVLARMKPGVTLSQANANMDAVSSHIADVYPKSNKGWSATVEPLKNDFLDRDVRVALWLLLGAVGFVLLIFVHECGHLIAAKRIGLKVGAPVFIPFMGAIIALKEAPRNAWIEAQAKPWDLAPLKIIAEEAGCVAFDFDGNDTIYGGNYAICVPALADEIKRFLGRR